MNINLNFFTFFIQKFSDICKKKKLANPQHPSGLPAFANAHSPRYAAVCKCLQPLSVDRTTEFCFAKARALPFRQFSGNSFLEKQFSSFHCSLAESF